MPEEKRGAKEEISPTPLEGAIADSPSVQQEAQEQIEGTQTPPAKEGEVQEEVEEQETEDVPLHEHPRFKEVIEEKNWYKNQMEQLMQLQQAPQQQPTTPQEPQERGNTPEEREFWRAQRQIAKEEAERVYQSKVTPQLQAGAAELARMKLREFRSNHPDVKANSPEEMEIANRIKTGYDIEDAYWATMGPRGVQRAADQQVKKQKQKIVAKKQANVEHTGSVKPILPEKPSSKRSTDEVFDEKWNKMFPGQA